MEPTSLSAAKDRIAAEIDRRAGLLVDVSHQIHARPELRYEERFAHDLLAGVLEREGLSVTRSARGVETAFEAAAGSSGPTVAVMCEYDALPGIGHACGHNIIAAAGLGAGLAAAALADELGGRVVVVGSPAEEGGGGKVRLIDGGTLEGVDAALMVHPADADLLAMDVVALHEAHVTYTGEAAHAAAAPHKGRNALDAAVLGYMNVAALRQQPPEGGPLALVDVADEFFVALRLTPSGDLRVLLSDVTAAEEWDLARQALDLVRPGEPPVPEATDEVWPAGDLGMFRDLGLDERELGAILADVDLWADELLGAVTARIGVGEPFGRVLASLAAIGPVSSSSSVTGGSRNVMPSPMVA